MPVPRGQALIICYRGRAEVQCAYASKLASWKARTHLHFGFRNAECGTNTQAKGVRRYDGTGVRFQCGTPKGYPIAACGMTNYSARSKVHLNRERET